jgi:hypothetical protein
MERDYRLTGKRREQSDKPIAPEAFKTSSWWKVCILIVSSIVVTTNQLYRPRNHSKCISVYTSIITNRLLTILFRVLTPGNAEIGTILILFPASPDLVALLCGINLMILFLLKLLIDKAS